MASSTLIKSLTRLYKNGSLTKEQITERVEKETVTTEEYERITGEAYSDLSELEAVAE